MIENNDHYAADEDDVRELLGMAKEFYRCSIQAYNQLEDSYLKLVKLHEQFEEIESAAEVMLGLCKARPDCFEGARWMASYYLSKDAPGEAAAYVRTAQRLRPRDPRIAPLMWNQKLTMARGLVLNRQFEAARQEINDAAGLTPADNDPCAFDLFRAAIELKSGNPDGAQSHIDAALSRIEEPAFVWMQMSSLAAVFQMPRGIRKQFDDRLAEEITKPVSSATAGRIARFLVRMRMTQTAYVGRAAHERLFIKYLKRTRRNPWLAEDLKSVCELLGYFPSEKRYRSELIEVGISTCSGIPQFAFWAAMELLNHRCSAQAERRLEELLSSAISLHQGGSTKLTESELETAMETLSMVKDRIESRQQYGSFGMFSSSNAIIADFDDDDIFPDDDEELPVDEESNELGFQMPLKLMTLMGINTDDDSDGFDVSENMLNTIERQMPPDVRSQLKQIAMMMGLPVKEAMRRLLVNMAREQQTSKEHRSQRGRSSGRSGK